MYVSKHNQADELITASRPMVAQPQTFFGSTATTL